MNICYVHKGKGKQTETEIFLRKISTYFESVHFTAQQLMGRVNDTSADVIVFDTTMYNGSEQDYHFMSAVTTNVPVLLIAGSSESSLYRQKMLDFGVDSCIQVPYLQEELEIRIMKLFTKKNTRLFSGTNIRSGDVVMDLQKHTVTTGNMLVFLTKTEYSILFHLFLNKNRLVSSRELLGCLDSHIKEDSLALNIHIFNLRKKIQRTNIIKTVPRYGFTVSNHATV